MTKATDGLGKMRVMETKDERTVVAHKKEDWQLNICESKKNGRQNLYEPELSKDEGQGNSIKVDRNQTQGKERKANESKT